MGDMSLEDVELEELARLYRKSNSKMREKCPCFAGCARPNIDRLVLLHISFCEPDELASNTFDFSR